MFAGRPGKTECELRAAGSWRKDRHGKRATPLLPLGTPVKPADLKGVACALWDSIAGTMPPMVLTGLDRPMLESACRWYARYREFEQQIKGKAAYRNAVLAALAWKNFEKCATHLGLSPVARNRLRIEAPTTPKDQKARFFA